MVGGRALTVATSFSRLLLATEHGEFDVGAESLAWALARHCGLPLAGVMPLVSNPEFEAAAPRQAAQADAAASARGDDLRAQAAAHGVSLNLVFRRGPELHEEIVEEASSQNSDLIIIRRRGKRGLLAQLLIGEMVSKVVAHAPCSVLIAPRGARMWTRRVLVGVDPLAPDDKVLRQAAHIAVDCGLTLQVVCVVGPEAGRATGEQVLATMIQQARACGATAEGEVRTGRPHQQLLAAAQASGADLLVMGRHSDEVLARAWIGGTAQKVIGLSECPVLVHVHPQAPVTAKP
jgi:nucleotide-binding universal stress UspA family protein